MDLRFARVELNLVWIWTASPAPSSKRQTRREAGAQSYGLLTALGGRLRLPGCRKDGQHPSFDQAAGFPPGSLFFAHGHNGVCGQTLSASPTTFLPGG